MPESTAELRIEAVPMSHPGAARLCGMAHDELVSRYGDEGADPPHAEDFEAPHGVFLVLWTDGLPVACGGVKRLTLAPRLGEIKRMFVMPAHRRQGLARRVLAAIEQEARHLGLDRLWLETGTLQPEAIALYESAGYSPIPRYGPYANDDWSVCFEKVLV
jgi:GNAT superfamily N-acetyltransferase